MASYADEVEKKRQALIKQRDILKKELPHLYGYKWYKWAKVFFESTNRMCLLCAGNQLSKSSTQIRKVIHWATDTSLWPILWPKSPQPRIFWYLYPDGATATTEFQKKWVPEFLPKRSGGVFSVPFKEECYDPIYGWKAYYDKKMIQRIEFRSGVTVYFKTYSQNVHNLQTATVHYIATDEELPEEMYSELQFRLQAVDGYFSMVFTATRGQLLWLLAMEGKGDMEKFPHALKLQVSAYDCIEYDDGSPGHYSPEKISKTVAMCKSKQEVDKRVNGRFVSDEGLKYPDFDPTRHYIPPFSIPKDWRYYAGVDPGTGGKGGHPAAMGIIAVRPDYRFAVVVNGCRMDDVDTTSADILAKFRELRGDIHCTLQTYDQAAKDFFIVASRVGEAFIPTNKSHEAGEDIVSILFKKDALKIFDTEELQKLGNELVTLKKTTLKRNAKDDFIDGALRYPAMIIPWDMTFLFGEKTEEEKAIEAAKPKVYTNEEIIQMQIRDRRGERDEDSRSDNISNWGLDFQAEMDFWNNF